jgi:hypothetical protein
MTTTHKQIPPANRVRDSAFTHSQTPSTRFGFAL